MDWGSALPVIAIVLAIVVSVAVAAVQIRSGGETRARELWQQEAEALRIRLQSVEEELISSKAKMAEMKTTISVLSSQVTNTQAIVDVEARLSNKISTLESSIITAIRLATHEVQEDIAFPRRGPDASI